MDEAELEEKMNEKTSQQTITIDDLIVSMSNLKIEDDSFNADLNKMLIIDYISLPKENQLKFSNPIRNYSHLLSNRLILRLIKLKSMLEDDQRCDIINQELLNI